MYKPPGLPLPPGPPGLPLLQNLFDIPTKRIWIAAMEWAKEYGSLLLNASLFCLMTAIGDLIHLGALGQHLIFVTSYETAVDLMEKRSALYSDRVHTPMMGLQATSSKWATSFDQYT
jgi:hypothetical protein